MGFSEEETAEFDRLGTIDAIDNSLKELGHETERIGTSQVIGAKSIQPVQRICI